MNGPGHRLVGAAAGGAYALHAGPHHWATPVVGAVVASATAHGWSSPDMDLCAPFRFLQSVTPNGGPFGDPWGHRRTTHWFGWPAAAWYAAPFALPVALQWTVLLLLAGWSSHIVMDAVFGTVPLVPWGGWQVGLGLDTGGWVERALTWGPLPLLVAWIAVGAPWSMP